MNELAVEYLPPDSLVPYSGNAREHSAEQLRQIARSISEFGFVTAVVVDAQNRVIAGHGRLLAAKTLKLARVPVVRITHLTETQLRAYRLADNKIAENATWDDGLLRVELDFLMSAEVNFDVDLTGFSTPEIDVLLGDDASDPPLPEGFESMPIISRLGDIWQLGPHRVACGDSRDAALLATLMQGEKAAMVFTDPPYNVPIGGMVSGLGKHRHAEFKMASGEMSCAEFSAFLQESLSAALSTCAAQALIYVCMDWRHLKELSAAYEALGLTLLNLAVWVKTNAGMGSLYRSQHELVFVLKEGHSSHTNNVELGRHGRYRTNVWQYAGMNSFSKERDAALAVHPTVKPIALVMDAMKDVTAHADIVFDGFLGSGTTVLAAHKTHRRGYGIELDPRYVDVCLGRWLARELHDDITQRLAGLAIDAAKLPGGGPSPLDEARSSIRLGLAQLSEDVHNLSYRLHPSVLDDLGLVEALKTECERVARSESVRVEVEADILPPGLSKEVALGIYRIAQEALRNVGRHARARTVQLSLTLSEGGVRLAVSDNGSGFEPDLQTNRPSLGHASMRERIRLLGGNLDIQSTPGRGTTVIAWVPISKAPS